MARGAIPVVVLAGFLGAGKTTLLNHVLRYAGGRRIGVLVNDFGSINIDLLLVSGQSGGTMDLANGCMCCTTDADDLVETLEAMAAPSAGLDAIVIEASGIAEPKALIRMVLAARGPAIAYGGLVYVIDAANIDATAAAYPQVAEHLSIADLVVCNKVDLLAPGALAPLLDRLREINSTAPIVPTDRAAIDPGLFFEPAERVASDDGPRQLTLDSLFVDEADGARGDEEPAHLHDGFESVSLQSLSAVDPRRLARFLERPPAGAYRIKGTVFVDRPGHRDAAYTVQAVGGFIQVESGSWRGRPRGTTLVVIGAGMDTGVAQAALDAVVGDVDPDDENGVLHLTRYLVTSG